MRQVQVLGGACLRVGTPCNTSRNARQTNNLAIMYFFFVAMSSHLQRYRHRLRQNDTQLLQKYHPKVFFKSAPGSTTRVPESSPHSKGTQATQLQHELSSLVPYRFRSINRRGGTQTINPEPKYPTKTQTPRHIARSLRSGLVRAAYHDSVRVETFPTTPHLYP